MLAILIIEKCSFPFVYVVIVYKPRQLQHAAVAEAQRTGKSDMFVVVSVVLLQLSLLLFARGAGGVGVDPFDACIQSQESFLQGEGTKTVQLTTPLTFFGEQYQSASLSVRVEIIMGYNICVCQGAVVMAGCFVYNDE